MKFTVNDKTYFVKWEYPDTHPDIYPCTTICKIYDGNTSYSNPIVEGVTTKGTTDNFCKNTGRKISLDRALLKLFPGGRDGRKARAIAWQEYFKESPKRLK